MPRRRGPAAVGKVKIGNIARREWMNLRLVGRVSSHLDRRPGNVSLYPGPAITIYLVD